MICLLAIAIGVSVRDARTRIIDNASCIFITVIGLAFQSLRALHPEAVLSVPGWGRFAERLNTPAFCILFSMLFLTCAVAIEFLYRRFTQQAGFGLGDVKYASAWAPLLGEWILPALCIALLAGALVAWSRHQETFAAGPWLSVGFYSVLLALMLAP